MLRTRIRTRRLQHQVCMRMQSVCVSWCVFPFGRGCVYTHGVYAYGVYAGFTLSNYPESKGNYPRFRGLDN
jgi:hypothetical protein